MYNQVIAYNFLQNEKKKIGYTKKLTSASQYVFKFSYSCMFSLLIMLNNFLNNVESKIEPFIRPSIEYGILYRHCQAWYQITWLEYSNESLSLSSSSIHNSQYFSWICGLVVLYRAVGSGGTGGTKSPQAILLHKLHPQKVLNYQLFTLRRPLDFQTFLRSYCMYICSTLSSSIHQHRQQLSANTMYCTC